MIRNCNHDEEKGSFLKFDTKLQYLPIRTCEDLNIKEKGIIKSCRKIANKRIFR